MPAFAAQDVLLQQRSRALSVHGRPGSWSPQPVATQFVDFSPPGAQDMGTSYTTTRAGSPSETARAVGVPLTRRGITSWSRLNVFCVCIVRGPSLRIHY